MQKSFTLIELLVVIAIIGLISSVVLVSTQGVQSKAKIIKMLEFSQSVNNSLGAYAVGLWSFDEGSGTTALDGSGYGNNGTIAGATYIDDTPHKEAGRGTGRWALNFPGAGQVTGNLPSNAIGLDGTAEAWVKLNSVAGSDAPIVAARAGGTWFGVASYYSNIAGEVYGSSDGASCGGATVGCSPAPGQSCSLSGFVGKWTHIIMSYSKSNNLVRFYINGNYVGSRTWYMCNLEAAQTFQIGGVLSTWTNSIIDEARIYSQVLSYSEIQKHYAEGLETHQNFAINP